MPKSNTEYWKPKIERNVSRDIDSVGQLHELGWNVIIVWECELKKSLIDSTIEQLISKLRYKRNHPRKT
jgi:DNA mismatch endonuclease (patch repair protein)